MLARGFSSAPVKPQTRQYSHERTVSHLVAAGARRDFGVRNGVAPQDGAPARIRRGGLILESK